MEATSASAGWVQASWWRRSNSAAFKDVNRFPSFSENWKQCIHLSRRLLNGGRRHKVGYARVATFQRNSGHFPGLSAAHELIERGFQVSIYEAKDVFGGKAHSLSVPGTGAGGREDLPGEHGFRFFPAFYRHLPDTMMRIPFPGNVSVFNNLVHATRIEVARAGSPALVLTARLTIISNPGPLTCCRADREA